MAHDHIDTSAEAVSKETYDEVTFIHYKLGMPVQTLVTSEDVKRRTDLYNQVTRDLASLKRSITEGD